AALPLLPPSPTRRSSDLAERFQRCQEERLACRVVADAETDVIEHGVSPCTVEPTLCARQNPVAQPGAITPVRGAIRGRPPVRARSEEHTSELQSREKLVC